MRVLLVSDMYARPERSISATYFHRQAVELARLGVEVRVLCPLPALPHRLGRRARHERSSSGYSIDGIAVTRLFYPKLAPFGWAARLGNGLLKRALMHKVREVAEDYDFELIHAIRLFPIASSLVPIAEATGRPLLALGVGSDVHTNPYGSRGMRELTRRAIEGSDRVAAVSRALARQILDLGQPRRRIATIYNGVDTDTFAPMPERRSALRRELGLPDRGPGMVMVSRLARAKGARELLEAFGELEARYEDAWLAIVGDGPESSVLRRRAASLGVASKVFFPGAQPHESIPLWLNAADVFVLPSYNEGLPNVVMEAMACGLPVVATDVGGTAEAVEEACTGFLVPPRSAAELVRPLERLLSDQALRLQFGHAGRDRAARVFGWRQSAESLLAIYEDMVGKGRSPMSGAEHPESPADS